MFWVSPPAFIYSFGLSVNPNTKNTLNFGSTTTLSFGSV